MHDLHVADQIHHFVLRTAKKHEMLKVAEINIELGTVVEHGASISPDNLRYNLELLNRGTAAEGAKINIKETRGNVWKLVSINGE
jgi:Zn finger protein HypA/HybF involved in hydrogenase expression